LISPSNGKAKDHFLLKPMIEDYYLSEEEDEKNNKKKRTSPTGTKVETDFCGSQKSRVCPNCNFANYSEADVCARCKVIF
jgi:hypothetical protein